MDLHAFGVRALREVDRRCTEPFVDGPDAGLVVELDINRVGHGVGPVWPDRGVVLHESHVDPRPYGRLGRHRRVTVNERHGGSGLSPLGCLCRQHHGGAGGGVGWIVRGVRLCMEAAAGIMGESEGTPWHHVISQM